MNYAREWNCCPILVVGFYDDHRRSRRRLGEEKKILSLFIIIAINNNNNHYTIHTQLIINVNEHFIKRNERTALISSSSCTLECNNNNKCL